MGARGGKPCLGVACADRHRPFIAGLTIRRRYHDPIGETKSLLYPLEANFGRTLILSTYRLAFHLSFGFAPRNVIICFLLGILILRKWTFLVKLYLPRTAHTYILHHLLYCMLKLLASSLEAIARNSIYMPLN